MIPHLHRDFSFDQQDNAFVAGGDAGGGGVSLITIALF